MEEKEFEPGLVQSMEDPPHRRRDWKTLVVVDLMESVRLMAEDEDGVIDRWLRFVSDVRVNVLPFSQGRLVKSLGDGFLLEFGDSRLAVAACLQIQARVSAFNDHDRPQSSFYLRLGIHRASVVVDDLDVFGHGVNLTARLAALATPGRIVVSNEVRDQLIAGVDAAVEDLGECFVKHMSAPVRVWGLRHEFAKPLPPSDQELAASIAVIPLTRLDGSSLEHRVGEIVGADLVRALSSSAGSRIVSQLSSSAFSDRPGDPRAQGRTLGAHYVVSGWVADSSGGFHIHIEVCDVTSGDVVWARDSTVATAALLGSGDERFVQIVAADILAAVLGLELSRFVDAPLPEIASFSALLGCIDYMHRMSADHSDRAGQRLEHLINLHPRSAEPRAWHAKWYMLCTTHRSNRDLRLNVVHAKAAVARALDSDPTHALSLAIDGQIAALVDADLPRALSRLHSALESNPSEPLAWLFLSNALANNEQYAESLAAASRANALSPLDPMRFMFDGFTANALLIAGDFEAARTRAVSSFRGNRLHLPTYPTLIVSEMACGQIRLARRHAREYMRRHPAVSVASYKDRLRAPRHFVDMAARMLKEAGLPD